MRQFACLDWSFESHRGFGRLSPVTVVYCQVNVSASDNSSGGVIARLVSLTDISKLRERRDHEPNTGRSATERNRKKFYLRGKRKIISSA